MGASDPERLARALVRVVHDGASVADAQDILQARELCGSRRSTSLVCEILPAGYELERREIAPDFGLGSAASMAPDQPLLLGIDIATAGCTSLVIDQDGRERARASVEYGYRSPRRVGPSKMQTSGGKASARLSVPVSTSSAVRAPSPPLQSTPSRGGRAHRSPR